MAKDEEARKKSGVQCQLGRDDLIKIKNIYKEMMKRKLKPSMKGFFIQSYSVNRVRGYSILQSRGMSMKPTWEVEPFAYLEDFGFG